jgi:P pilus assembly chaperone PapD
MPDNSVTHESLRTTNHGNQQTEVQLEVESTQGKGKKKRKNFTTFPTVVA